MAKLADAALIAHGDALLLTLPPVLEADGQAAVEEGLLAQAGAQDIVVVDRIVEHLGVRLEADRGPGPAGLAHDMDLLQNIAAGKAHGVDFSFLVNLDLQPLGKGVDNRSTDAVQTAGDLVPAAAELAAGVQHGKDNLKGALSGLLLNIDGDAAAVVGNADDVPRFDDHLDVGAVAGKRLVDGVVHDLVDKMMQTG